MYIFKLLMSAVLIIMFSCSNVVFAEDIVISKNTRLEGKLITPVHSKYNKKGDVILFSISDSYTRNGIDIIPEGTTGKAVVTDSQKAGYFGVGGRIFFEPQSLVLMNGMEVPLMFKTGKNSDWRDTANQVVATAAVGIFAGFFQGKNQNYPAGSKFYLYVKEDVNLGSEEDVERDFLNRGVI